MGGTLFYRGCGMVVAVVHLPAVPFFCTREGTSGRLIFVHLFVQCFCTGAGVLFYRLSLSYMGCSAGTWKWWNDGIVGTCNCPTCSGNSYRLWYIADRTVGLFCFSVTGMEGGTWACWYIVPLLVFVVAGSGSVSVMTQYVKW